MQRPDQIARMMMRAELESLFSTCRRLATGAIIFDDYWGITSTGYNGAPKDQRHCIDTVQTKNPKERCQICIHAERNAGNTAARQGKSTLDHSIAVLHRPCVSCANDIIQLGLIAVYYRHDYDTDGMGEYVHKMMTNRSILVEKVKMDIHQERFSKMIGVLRESMVDSGRVRVESMENLCNLLH